MELYVNNGKTKINPQYNDLELVSVTISNDKLTAIRCNVKDVSKLPLNDEDTFIVLEVKNASLSYDYHNCHSSDNTFKMVARKPGSLVSQAPNNFPIISNENQGPFQDGDSPLLIEDPDDLYYCIPNNSRRAYIMSQKEHSTHPFSLILRASVRQAVYNSNGEIDHYTRLHKYSNSIKVECEEGIWKISKYI